MNSKKIVGILILVGLFICLQAHSANWYLNRAATGSNSGTSWDNGWVDTTNVVFGVYGVNTGDTLWVKGSATSYWGLSILASAGAKPGITVRIATNETVQATFGGNVNSEINDIDNFVINGNPGNGSQMIKFIGKTDAVTNGAIMFRLRNSTNVYIDSLELTREGRFDVDDTDFIDGIKLSNASGANDLVIITNCYIHHISGDGIAIDNPGPGVGYDRYKILNCVIERTMDDAVQCSGNITMKNCIVNRLKQFPTYGGHQDGIQTAIGAQWIWLENELHIGYTQCYFLEEARGPVHVLNCIAMSEGKTDGTARGFVLSVGADWIAGREYVAINNIAAGFITYYGVQSGSLSTSGSKVVKTLGNFIFIDCKYAVAGSSWVGANNIFWNSPGVVYYDAAGNPSGTPSDQQYGLSSNVDPKFVNYSIIDYNNFDYRNYNFRLLSNSPAIRTGVEHNDKLSVDRDGNKRGLVWDIGPYEYIGPRTTTVNTVNLHVGQIRKR